MNCSTVVVSLAFSDVLDTVVLTAPAFTRTEHDFRAQVALLLEEYILMSRSMQMGLSVADFGIRLLAVATTEPFEQEGPNLVG